MKPAYFFLTFACLSLLSSPVAAAEKKDAPKSAPVKVDAKGNITKEASRDFALKQFRLFDRDKDGSFTMADYRVPFDAVAKARKDKNSPADEKAIKDSFTRMDNDNNGKISKEEYLHDADLRFAAMDADKNGVVSPKEIEDLQKKMIAAHKKAAK